MNIIKYPSEEEVNKAMAADEPLLVLISFDGQTAIMSHIDEAVEHHILLMNAGFKDTDIDKFSASSSTRAVLTGPLFVLRTTRTNAYSLSIRTVVLLFQTFSTL